MATSSMGTGGAETHIAELCRAMRAREHRVAVCSAGGALADQLSEQGFAHYRMPLNSHKISDVAACYRQLRDLLACERFDIVHAHARIPAMLIGRLRRQHPDRYGFRFCVTCHAKFRRGALDAMLAEWGDGTIAVSEDLRADLSERFGRYPDRITVIPNGVDCDRFSPASDTHGYLLEAAGEFPVSEDDRETERREILYMSRLDEDCSEVAEQLIRLTPSLRERYPGLRVTVIGGGNAHPRLSGLARSCGVIMPGEVADPLPYLRRCSVFVGVSRAALEAMATAKPVILAGNEGYLGILGGENLQKAEKTNYTCRGYRPAGSFYRTPEAPGDRLFEDLCTLLDAGEDERRALGAGNRQTICRYHSAADMAKNAEDFYRTLPTRASGRRILVGGYFGYGNSGDDAIAEMIVKKINQLRPDVSVTLLTNRPWKDEKQYGVPCVARTDLFAMRKAMCRSELYLSGSGSLYQNLTSNRSLSYYLGVLKMAQRHHLKTAVFSGGVGPLHGIRAEQDTAAVLSRVSHIGLRDQTSAEYLARIGVPEEKLKLGADPAILTPPAEKGRLDDLAKRLDLRADGRYLAVSVAHADGCAGTKLSAVLSEVCRKNRLTPLYFLLFPEQDREGTQQICTNVGFGGRILLPLTPRETVGLLAHCLAAISTRLHLLVYAVAAGIPCVGLSGSDPKIPAFCKEAALPDAVRLPAASPEKCAALFRKILERREEICHNITGKRTELRQRVLDDLEQILSLIP